MSILFPKFPKLGIDFWKGVIMTVTGSPIYPDWDEPPEEKPNAPVSVDRTENTDDGDIPADDLVLSQKIAGSQQKAPQGETILR